jgi:hypothetical protein
MRPGFEILFASVLLMFLWGCGDSSPSDSPIDGASLQDLQPLDTLSSSEVKADLIPWKSGECPPEAPFGKKEGKVLKPMSFQACDGKQIDLSESCGARATVIYNLYGWCPSCHEYLTWIQELAEVWMPKGLQVMVIITEDGVSGVPTLQYCQGIKDHYKLMMPLMIDPLGELKAYGGVGLVLILQEGGVIVLNKDGPPQRLVEKILAALIPGS